MTEAGIMHVGFFRVTLNRLFVAGALVLAAGLAAAQTPDPPSEPPAADGQGKGVQDVAPAVAPSADPGIEAPDVPQETAPEAQGAPPQAPKDVPQQAPQDAQPPNAQPQAPKETPPAGPPPPHTGVKATLRAIPGDFGHLPTRATFWTLAAGGALAAAASPLDDDVNRHLRGNQAVHNFFWTGKVLGSVPAQLVMVGALYSFGRATNNRVVSHLGMDLLRSSIEVGALTYAIKLSVRRKRPTGNCCSFPSGHASVTFATASVLWRHLGWKAAVPTYTVASYVALSRLHENVHFLSDVVFGASLGIVVGRTVTRHGRGNYAWAPVPVRGGMMVVVSRVRP